MKVTETFDGGMLKAYQKPTCTAAKGNDSVKANHIKTTKTFEKSTKKAVPRLFLFPFLKPTRRKP